MLKKIFLIVCMTIACGSSQAQLRSVITDLHGKAVLDIRVGNSGRLILSMDGNVIDVFGLRGEVRYYSDFNNYEAGKIKEIDGVQFTYHSDFYDYQAGKIKSVGDLKFSYYSSFYDYESGKVKAIGDAQFSYYSSFNDYESGKIKSVGGVNFSYYSTFNSYESGKLKSIGSQKYTYFSDFDSRNIAGQIKSGNWRFTQNGITFVVKN